MAGQLLGEFEHYIDDLLLIPSKGGVFEVELDGVLVYSKKATKRHADYEDVAPGVRKILGRPDPEPQD